MESTVQVSKAAYSRHSIENSGALHSLMCVSFDRFLCSIAAVMAAKDVFPFEITFRDLANAPSSITPSLDLFILSGTVTEKSLASLARSPPTLHPIFKTHGEFKITTNEVGNF